MKLILAIVLFFSVISCVKNEPLTNDSDVPAKMSEVQSAISLATRGLSPESMNKNEWALFQFQARLYTSPFQGMGYEAYQVLEKKLETTTIEDTLVDLAKLDILQSNYNEPENTDDPPVLVDRKEWNCDFIRSPYLFWYNECELPPYQNFLLFYPLQTDDNLLYFYNLKKYSGIEKLPINMIQEGRCYGFENCEYIAEYVEFDLITFENGVRERVHVKNVFNSQLPYLASNSKQCINTLVTIEGKTHPYEICRVLVDFKYQ